MDIGEKVVYGERVGDVVPALLALLDAGTIDEDGMFAATVRLEPSIADPFFRALMRAEAELLLEDASLPKLPPDLRTSERRGVDAILRLAEAIGKAA